MPTELQESSEGGGVVRPDPVGAAQGVVKASRTPAKKMVGAKLGDEVLAALDLYCRANSVTRSKAIEELLVYAMGVSGYSSKLPPLRAAIEHRFQVLEVGLDVEGLPQGLFAFGAKPPAAFEEPDFLEAAAPAVAIGAGAPARSVAPPPPSPSRPFVPSLLASAAPLPVPAALSRKERRAAERAARKGKASR